LAAAKVAEFALVADETPEQFWERTKKKIRALEKTVDVLMKRDPIFSELCWEAADNAIIWIGAENLASQFKDAPWSIVQTFFQTKLADLARDAYQAVQRTLQQEEEAARAQATGTLTTRGTELLPTPTHDESEGHGEGGATAGNSSGGGGKGGGGGEDSVEANDAQASGGGGGGGGGGSSGSGKACTGSGSEAMAISDSITLLKPIVRKLSEDATALEALLRDVASYKDEELEGGLNHLEALVANLTIAVPVHESINKSAGALRAIVEVVRTAAETRRRAELAERAARDEGRARTLHERKLALWLLAGKHANAASGASPMRQQLGAAGNSRPGPRGGPLAPAAQWAHARVDAIESLAKECAPEAPMTVDPMQAILGRKAPAAKPKPIVTPKPTEVASQLRLFDELCPLPVTLARRMLEGEEFREFIVSDLKEAAKLEKHLDDDVHFGFSARTQVR